MSVVSGGSGDCLTSSTDSASSLDEYERFLSLFLGDDEPRRRKRHRGRDAQSDPSFPLCASLGHYPQNQVCLFPWCMFRTLCTVWHTLMELQVCVAGSCERDYAVGQLSVSMPEVGKTKRNRANILCSPMESMNIEIVAVQEPHLQSLDNICFAVIVKRDYHGVGGMVARGRGGVCVLLSQHWGVMHSEHIQPRILVAKTMYKLDLKPTVLAAHFSDQVDERLVQWDLLIK